MTSVSNVPVKGKSKFAATPAAEPARTREFSTIGSNSTPVMELVAKERHLDTAAPISAAGPVIPTGAAEKLFGTFYHHSLFLSIMIIMIIMIIMYYWK